MIQIFVFFYLSSTKKDVEFFQNCILVYNSHIFQHGFAKKREQRAPGELSSSPSIDTLQALRLEMTEDYYYDLPDRRMCSERRGVLI